MKAAKCKEEGCRAPAKGFDIERAYGEGGSAIYAISYICAEGHEFILEVERDDHVLPESMGD